MRKFTFKVLIVMITIIGFTINTNAQTPGESCTDPIVVNLPADDVYTHIGQTTNGMINNYSSDCVSASMYSGGEDVIYEINISYELVVDITLDPKTTDMTSIFLYDICPAVLSMHCCHCHN